MSQIATYPASSGGLTLIQSQTLSTSAASVTFSGIPQTFSHLKLIINSVTSVTSAAAPIELTINGDSGAHYFYNVITNSFGTNPTAVSTSSAAFAVMGDAGDNNASAAGNEITIMGYSGSTFGKAMTGVCSSTTLGVYTTAGLWTQTAPVTSVTLTLGSGTFTAGSTFSLYGMQ